LSVDPSGQVNNRHRAVDILGSDAMNRIREKNPEDVVLADCHKRIVPGEATGGSPVEYIEELRERAFIGAIVGQDLLLTTTGKQFLASVRCLDLHI
jgi:hypothetical protein